MANVKIEKAVEKKKFAQLKKMAEGRDASLRLEALEAMGKIGGEESFNYLTGTLRSQDAAMRGAAADGLGHLKDSKARAFLDHQLKSESDEGTKAKIHAAMAAVRSAS